MKRIDYIDEFGSFRLKEPTHYSGLYLPTASLKGLKSALSPDFGGDAKTDQNHFLIGPKSILDLSTDRDTRNFFCEFPEELWSVTGVSAVQEYEKFTASEDETILEAGRMWQKVTRKNQARGLEATTTGFCLLDKNTEIMRVEIKNISKEPISFEPVAAIPLFCRSADNIRDHRHVTSLLNRAEIMDFGIRVKPTLSFDERGHQVNDTVYYCLAAGEDGRRPKDFIADVEAYLGEGGNHLRPRALLDGRGKDDIWMKPGEKVDGKENIAVIRFDKISLGPGQTAEFNLAIGLLQDDLLEEINEITQLVQSSEKLDKIFLEVKEYWNSKNPIYINSGNARFDNFMSWVGFQPQLRRIFGCSFLPHHDYGRGGRGWRDLWQDCLALLLTEADTVRQMLLDNFKGVRVDGTNATIIGTAPGEFKSDRNGIARVWMDHGFWPWLTVKLYMDQTGDLEIFDEVISYFRNKGESSDSGTVLEHLLLENIVAFYDVGKHNECLLHNADWNDALDMAADNGESVAFTNGYAGNLKDLSTYLRIYKAKTGIKNVSIAKELEELLQVDTTEIFEDPYKKQALLKEYRKKVADGFSGEKTVVEIEKLAILLERKGDYMMKQIRQKEWVEDTQGNGWFNGYYDNESRQVEGEFDNGICMMLTSQVFAIMCGTAKNDAIKSIVESADKYLYEGRIGGYRLNTDFKELRTDLGRMFGFSYGDKENGAVFSHMAVMYGNALYRRGFVKEGFKALNALFETADDFERSFMYPGVPEYFNGQGRGLYSYLTGAASWYLYTVVTEVFGVRGNAGDLHIEPKLLLSQFDERGVAEITVPFAGHKFTVKYLNTKKKEFGSYTLDRVIIDGTCDVKPQRNCVSVPRKWIDTWNEKEHIIEIELI